MYRYELLDVAIHDRNAFSSGVVELDRYLQQQARQDMRARVAAIYIQRMVNSPAILGYYTISNLAIEARDLPPELVRRLPRYPILPATLIGRLAVDQRHRGKGLGGLLLFDALKRGLHAGIASMAMVVDAKDANAQRFYEHYGFRQLTSNENRLFLPMKDIALLFPE
jgi:GNAT superfamily N-acetyltransferase